jgi:hypothetical protein
MSLQTWATNFPDRKPEHFVFPWEHYGFAGDKAHAKTMDPDVAVGDIRIPKRWAQNWAQCDGHPDHRIRKLL